MTLKEMAEKMADRNCRQVERATGVNYRLLLELKQGNLTDEALKRLADHLSR